MLAGRDGQPVGDQPQRGRVEAEADVTAAELRAWCGAACPLAGLAVDLPRK
jgi:hypothetical protein